MKRHNLMTSKDELRFCIQLGQHPKPEAVPADQKQENPELCLDLSEVVEQLKRLKMNGGCANGNQNPSGGIGSGEWLNAAQKERMQLLTTAAFDREKCEDTFGTRDEDWQLYKLMCKDNDDGQEEDEAELSHISARLQASSM
ncbi:Actin-related protein 5 [Asimina triloba]